MTTVRQLIYWEYAKPIARAAGFEENYGFIVSRYKKLVSDEMSWSSSVRVYEKELEKGRVCACKTCNSKKGDKDVFEWFGTEQADKIPKLVLSSRGDAFRGKDGRVEEASNGLISIFGGYIGGKIVLVDE